MMHHIAHIPIERHVDREGDATCDGCPLRMQNDAGKHFCPFRRSPTIEWDGLAPHEKCPVWSSGATMEYRSD
ncbi:MAG TPA: hypothetical protein PLE60_14850, partial [Candidatus Latescibacteria bacterium]|nr:hypothetical protein [Candidatus Latescibacterota bacterium]